MEQSEQTAYHEAGHAVAAYVLRRRFSKVTIVEHEDSVGSMTLPPSYWSGFNPDVDQSRGSRARIEKEIMVLLAGEIAVDIHTGREDWGEVVTYLGSDLHTASDLADYVTTSSDESEAFLNWLIIRTRNMLSLPHWSDAVNALAAALIEHGEIGYRKARQIIRFALGS